MPVVDRKTKNKSNIFGIDAVCDGRLKMFGLSLWYGCTAEFEETNVCRESKMDSHLIEWDGI